MTIQEFIKIHNEDFDTYKYKLDWNGYKVYDIWLKADEGACIGYPSYALEKEGQIREANFKEVLAIMDAEREAYPELYKDEE